MISCPACRVSTSGVCASHERVLPHKRPCFICGKDISSSSQVLKLPYSSMYDGEEICMRCVNGIIDRAITGARELRLSL